MVAAVANPTLDLEDPDKWVVYRRVAIFDEHDEWQLPGGKVVFTRPGQQPPAGAKLIRHFGPDELQEIADHNNLRAEATGDFTPIVIGHTRPNIPEEEQPEIVGFGKDFGLSLFGKDNRTVLHTTFCIRKDKHAKAMEYPRRSVELWKSDMVIDPIALLKRTPQRDLGLLTYDRTGRPGRIFYSMEDFSVNDTPPPAAGDDNDDALVQKMSKHFIKADHPAWKYACDQHAKYSAPSGSNTAMPGPDDIPPPPPPPPSAGAAVPPPPPGDDKLRMQKEQESIYAARYEKRIADLEAQIAADRKVREKDLLAYQRTERERDLVQLQAEGYEFDRAELLDDLAALPAEQYAKRLVWVRKYAKRAPVSNGWVPTYSQSVEPTGEAQGMSGEQYEKAMQYMRTHECEWEEAMTKVGYKG